MSYLGVDRVHRSSCQCVPPTTSEAARTGYEPCVRTVIVVASSLVRFGELLPPSDDSNGRWSVTFYAEVITARGTNRSVVIPAHGRVATPTHGGLRRGTMLVTDSAYRDLESRSTGVFDRLGKFAGWLLRRPASVPAAESPFAFPCNRQTHRYVVALHHEDQPLAEPIDLGTIASFRWRRHPQLLNRFATDHLPDSEDLERSARSAGVRGLFLARSGRVDEARAAFAVAATESSVDLSAIPGFWDLSRSGMMAAVSAYDDVERYRDASALGAQIRVTYRPRSVSVGLVPPKKLRSDAGSQGVM